MRKELKVGIFVIVGGGLLLLAVFLIGQTTRMWEARTDYVAAFQDVGGLKPGSPVRMGGVDIGSVTSVAYSRDIGETRIFVRMSVVRSQTDRIRADSVATVGNKGLLGDKLISISVGTTRAPKLDPKQLVASQEPADIFAAAQKVAATAQESVEQLEPLVKSLGDPKLANDIKGAVADIHSILSAVVHGDGTMHRLFYDARDAQRVDDLLAHLDESSSRLPGVLSDVQDVTDQVRKGPGIAHALLYDGELSRDVAGSLVEVHKDLQAIREGNGLAHALLYGDSSSQHVMSNLNAMSDDLRAIVSGVRDGKGTLGALLVDPTVYEDIKAAIGNVERNNVLRALVRYS
ncbi:MAG: MlaD family protein, partial [Polyangiaceae bacterium]|nr:MlaD family protein [Polyangiaceae bacterium]